MSHFVKGEKAFIKIQTTISLSKKTQIKNMDRAEILQTSKNGEQRNKNTQRNDTQ
jgi:hypothetical protein